MYEVTVSVPKQNEHLLAHIKQRVSLPVAEMDGICTDLCDGYRCYLSVACSDTFRFQLRRICCDSISDAVAVGFKNIFLRSLMNIGRDNFLQNVLVNTMCIFDRSYDKQTISKMIDVDQPVFIDGYCNFRMDTLKRKWTEIARLVSENNYIMHDSRLITDFLQYLLDSVNSKVSELTLTLDGDDFWLYDSGNNVLPSVSSMSDVYDVEQEAALNVLVLKPQKLTVYYSKKPSEDFVRLMKLFDCKFVQTN